jgi:regulatory protein
VTSVRRRVTTPVPEDPAEALGAACTKGLRLLAARELSEAAVRQRLIDAGFLSDTVAAALDKLRQSGALNEGRAIQAVARTLVRVKRRGRLRALRELEARGFSHDDAASALAELLGDADERDAVERALTARLRGRSLEHADPAAIRRLMAALLRQGHPPGLVRDAVRRRARGIEPVEVDAADEDLLLQ